MFGGQTITTIEQGGFDSEVILCIDTKFKRSVDLTVIESYNGFATYLISLS